MDTSNFWVQLTIVVVLLVVIPEIIKRMSFASKLVLFAILLVSGFAFVFADNHTTIIASIFGG